MNDSTTTELVKAETQAIGPRERIRNLLTNGKQAEEFGKALPEWLPVERFTRFCLTAVNKSPRLLESTEESLMLCMMQLAEVGLEPGDVLGRAYLIPYRNRNKNVYECSLQIGYRGLSDLGYRTDRIKDIDAAIVYQGEHFSFQRGSEQFLKHQPELEIEKTREKVRAVWSAASLTNGGYRFEVFTPEQVERIRKRSKAATDGPWVTDWEEMAKKTVFKNLAKYLPMSPRLSQAVAIDNEHEVDRGRSVTPSKLLESQEEGEPEAEALYLQLVDRLSEDEIKISDAAQWFYDQGKLSDDVLLAEAPDDIIEPILRNYEDWIKNFK